MDQKFLNCKYYVVLFFCSLNAEINISKKNYIKRYSIATIADILLYDTLFSSLIVFKIIDADL